MLVFGSSIEQCECCNGYLDMLICCQGNERTDTLAKREVSCLQPDVLLPTSIENTKQTLIGKQGGVDERICLGETGRIMFHHMTIPKSKQYFFIYAPFSAHLVPLLASLCPF